MASLFHFVPEQLVGTVLYPLNELKEREPAVWRREAAKYNGREQVVATPVPPLECLWSDVLHLATVHPAELVAALEAAGLQPPRRRAFRVDAATLDPARTAIFLNRSTDPSARFDESQWEPFERARVADLARLTVPTRRYYRERATRGTRPRLFGYLAHVFFRGALETSNLDVVEL